MPHPLVRTAVGASLCAAWICGCSLRDDGSAHAGARLSWAPDDCVARYEVRVGESTPTALELRFERDAAGEFRRDRWNRWVGEVTLVDPSAGTDAPRRRLSLTANEPRPAAPDAECRTRPVDLTEHVLALGWPRLPDRTVAVGTEWIGRAPDGACDELACFDPRGAPNGRPCIATAWRARLTALEPPAAGHGPIAVVEDRWSDGGAGARAERVSRFDVRAGRLLSARTTVWPPFAGRADQEERGPLVTRVDLVECARP